MFSFFTFPGGVVIFGTAVDERVRAEIEDDGPGIPDGMKSEVFDRNVTSESSGSIGFGLYFVHVMMNR